MSWHRRIEIAVGLCGVVLAEGFFLLTIGGLLVVWLLPVAGVVFALLPSVPGGPAGSWFALSGVSLLLLVAAQAHFVRRHTRTTLQAGELERPDAKQEIETLVSRLAQQAGVARPAVVIASTPVPASLTVGGFEPTIVVTEGLLARLENEAELNVVLAHEVGHIANRDVTLTSVAAAVPITIGGVIERVVELFRWLLRVDEDEELSDTTRSLLVYVAPILAVFGLGTAAIVLFPILVGMAYVLGDALGGVTGAVVLPGVIALLLVQLVMLGIVLVFALPTQALAYVFGSAPAAYLSRRREFAADRVAAELTGDPETLATVLRRLDDDVAELPSRDARTLRGVQHLCLAPFETAGDPTVQSSFDSHPPTEDRLAQLRELASE